jgi:hypothetical protein
MRTPPQHLSALSFGIGLGVLASIGGDQWRHRVRWVAGQPFTHRSERKGLGWQDGVSSSQAKGVETQACGTARTTYGGTAWRPRAFCKTLT